MFRPTCAVCLDTESCRIVKRICACSDQTAHVCSLICAYAVRECLKTHFSMYHAVYISIQMLFKTCKISFRWYMYEKEVKVLSVWLCNICLFVNICNSFGFIKISTFYTFIGSKNERTWKKTSLFKFWSSKNDLSYDSNTVIILHHWELLAMSSVLK